MKVLIYSDVHGNLPAFEKMLQLEGVCDQYISLGDLVNYGPWSNECVELALSLPNSICIKGNHEIDFLKNKYSGANPLVQSFFQQTFPYFNKFNDIATFVDNFKLDKYNCLHTIEDKNIYPDSEILLDDNYIIGHSHHQFKIENNNFQLYNAGSVGQNRGGVGVANYLIYEHDKINMKSFQFDVNILLNKLKRMNYSDECINYLMKQ